MDALQSLRPGAEWVMRGLEYENLEWIDETQSCPTEAEISAEILRLTDKVPLDECKAKAKLLIAASDWSVLPDVPISNKSEFEAYRTALRMLIISPVVSPTWPVEPQPIWITSVGA